MPRFRRTAMLPRFRRIAPPNNKKPANNNTSKNRTITVSNNNDGGNGGRPRGKNGNGRFTENRKIFADEWLKDRNGTRAYKAAYPTVKNDNVAAVQASILLRKPKVVEYIAKGLGELRAKTQIDQEGIVKRYLMLTDYHITDFFNDNGTMKSLSQIPKEKLYAIQGFKADEKVDVNNEEVIKTLIREFKLSNKKDVLDSLARHLGMFEKDNSQRGAAAGGGGEINFNAPVQINVRLTGDEG